MRAAVAWTGAVTTALVVVHEAPPSTTGVATSRTRPGREEEIQETAFSFFGEQGPWYTVGWRMAVLIEKTYGRRRLIETFCEGRSLPAEFNKAAARSDGREPLATWSASLTSRLASGGGSDANR